MRPTRLIVANVVVWGALVLLVAIYAEPLRWAFSELPEYLDGEIDAPIERTMYRDARDIIRDGGDLERARELLERSLAIDPTCEAGYWLARYHLETGDDEAALARLERYLEIDPMMPRAWLDAVDAAERLGRRDEAARLARRGAEYFDSLAKRSVPRPNRAVREKFDDKAREVYVRYFDAAVELEARLAELTRSPADAG